MKWYANIQLCADPCSTPTHTTYSQYQPGEGLLQSSKYPITFKQLKVCSLNEQYAPWYIHLAVECHKVSR